MVAGGLDGNGFATKTYTVTATMITIRAASIAAVAAEPLILLRFLGRINLAPVVSRACSARWDCILNFIRHHIQAEPNIKSDCKGKISRVFPEKGLGSVSPERWANGKFSYALCAVAASGA